VDINGEDITLRSLMSPEASSILLERYLKNKFDSQLVERESGNEFFFYINQEAKDSWDEEGWTEEFSCGMIHVITEEGCVTIVNERNDLDFEEIENNLRINSCF